MRRFMLVSGLALCCALICGSVGAMVAKAPVPSASPRTITATVTSIAASDLPVEDFPLAKGHIVAIDDHAGRITIRHKGVRRYELPAQTAVFTVDDRALLTGLTPGDKIRFDLQRVSGHYVVTRIENSN